MTISRGRSSISANWRLRLFIAPCPLFIGGVVVLAVVGAGRVPPVSAAGPAAVAPHQERDLPPRTSTAEPGHRTSRLSERSRWYDVPALLCSFEAPGIHPASRVALGELTQQ